MVKFNIIIYVYYKLTVINCHIYINSFSLFHVHISVYSFSLSIPQHKNLIPETQPRVKQCIDPYNNFVSQFLYWMLTLAMFFTCMHNLLNVNKLILLRLIKLILRLILLNYSLKYIILGKL